MRFRKFNHYIYNTYNILPILSLTILAWLVVSFIAPDNYSYNAEAVYAADANNPNKTTPTASLTVSNSGTQEINVQPNSGTIYSNHTITMSSVNINSYALTISGPAELKSISGNTTLTGANNSTGSGMPNNSWGYSYNANGVISNNDAAIYKSFTGTAQNLESGTTPSTVEKSLVLAAKFSDTAEPGHYTGQINLSLTAVPKVLTTYSITYNANSGSGAPSTWSDSSYDDSYTTTISNTTPTRSGYTFLGWNTSSASTSANSNYAAGTSITLTSSSATLNLVAVWEEQFVDFPSTLTKMQDMTSAICSAASTGATKTLTDSRDGSTYTIKKVGSKCWMTQNLRIVNKNIDSSNSNIISNYTIPASAIWSSADSTIQKAYYNNNTAYGAYYSWCTATANNCGTAKSDGAEASYDICPKGWQLPSGKIGARINDFAIVAGLISVNITYGTDYWSNLSNPSFTNSALTVNGVSWPAAGLVLYGGSVSNMGSVGYYWSRTAKSDNDAYYLSFNASYFRPSIDGSRYNGCSIRCVAK